MTPPALAIGDLPNAVPTLVADHAVVVLMASDDLQLAAYLAWAVARAAASGRRVALIDLSLERHALDGPATNPSAEGVVDVFEHGASLSHVAREQAVPGLFYIGGGTPPADAAAILGNARWQRLARGFAQEGALLLLFAPLDALAGLSLKPDALVWLGAGDDPSAHARAEWAEVPILARVIARPSTAAVAEVPPATPAAPLAGRRASGPVPMFTPRRPSRRRRGISPLVWILLGIPVLAAAGYLFLRPQTPPRSLVPPPTGFEDSVRDTVTDRKRAAARPEPVLPTPAPAAGDTLYYSVQVAAFNALPAAMQYANRLAPNAGLVTVTPVSLGRQGVWYRVVVGALPSPSAADSVRRALWRDGLVDRPQGTILRTPNAYLLNTYPSRGAAEDGAQGVRDQGVPAYIVAEANGTFRLMLGAFEAPEQATAADSLLRALGSRATLITRIGTPE